VFQFTCNHGIKLAFDPVKRAMIAVVIDSVKPNITAHLSRITVPIVILHYSGPFLAGVYVPDKSKYN